MAPNEVRMTSVIWETGELADLRICLPALTSHRYRSAQWEKAHPGLCAIYACVCIPPPSFKTLTCSTKGGEREREKRLSRNSSVKQYRVPLKTSDKKAHMIPELQSPIPSAKAASAFLSVWMLQQHGGEKKIQDKAKKKKKNWRNVTIQRSFSWRGGNWCERSYSGTPLSLETLDQNGRLQSRAAFLFIFFPLPLSLSLLDLLQIWAT